MDLFLLCHIITIKHGCVAGVYMRHIVCKVCFVVLLGTQVLQYLCPVSTPFVIDGLELQSVMIDNSIVPEEQLECE